MKKLDLILKAPFSKLTFKQKWLRYFYRLLIMLLYMIITYIAIIALYYYNFDEKIQITESYIEALYPVDTTFYGVVLSIDEIDERRTFEFLTIPTNKVIILSDTSEFSVNVNDVTFNVNDSVKVNVEQVKLKGDVNDVKTTISSKFGEKSETYWKLKNLSCEKIINEEIKNIK